MANLEHSTCKRIVSSLCKNPKEVNWGIEIKTAKKLLKLFPDIESILDKEEYRICNSLLFFITPKGKIMIKKWIEDTKLTVNTPKTEYNTGQQELIGESKTYEKPKNVLDFLK